MFMLFNDCICIIFDLLNVKCQKKVVNNYCVCFEGYSLKIFDSKIYRLLKREIKIFKICSFLKNIYHILYNELFKYIKM